LRLKLARATATAAGIGYRSRSSDILFEDVDSSNVNRLHDETFTFLTIILFDHLFSPPF